MRVAEESRRASAEARAAREEGDARRAAEREDQRRAAEDSRAESVRRELTAEVSGGSRVGASGSGALDLQLGVCKYMAVSYPIPHTLYLIPYTLFPVPYTLYPIPYTPYPIPYTLYPIP